MRMWHLRVHHRVITIPLVITTNNKNNIIMSIIIMVHSNMVFIHVYFVNMHVCLKIIIMVCIMSVHHACMNCGGIECLGLHAIMYNVCKLK